MNVGLTEQRSDLPDYERNAIYCYPVIGTVPVQALL
jgi:hypothetical protein